MRTAWGWSWPRARASVVELGGPGAGAAGVAGEVARRRRGAACRRPSGSRRSADLAGLAGGGGDAGQAGQRFGGGEPGAAVADLGEQPGGADGAGAGQRGEDVRVGVQGELLGDLGGQGLDLLDEAGQDGEQGAGDVRWAAAVVAGGAAGCGGQAGVQYGGVGAAAVALALASQAASRLGDSQSARSWAVEAGQERQADRRVDARRTGPTAPGKAIYAGGRAAGWRTATRWRTRSLRARQAWRRVTVAGLSGDQRAQPGPVGAQRVGQHERVEPVILVARPTRSGRAGS